MRTALNALVLAVGLGVLSVSVALAGSETRTIIKNTSDEVGVKVLRFEVDRDDDSDAKKAADEAEKAKDRAQAEQDNRPETDN